MSSLLRKNQLNSKQKEHDKTKNEHLLSINVFTESFLLDKLINFCYTSFIMKYI